MSVRDLKAYLADLQQEDGRQTEAAELAELVNATLTLAGADDDMDIKELILRLTSVSKTKRPPSDRGAHPNETIARLVKRLHGVFYDDDQFQQELEAIRSQRGATKAILTEVFLSLFNRTRGVPKSATRDELFRLISDERHILVRNEKMGKMLGRRVVPAE